jgi:hypothetical protein
MPAKQAFTQNNTFTKLPQPLRKLLLYALIQAT